MLLRDGFFFLRGMQSNGCRCSAKVSGGRWQVNTIRTFQDNGWVTRYLGLLARHRIITETLLWSIQVGFRSISTIRILLATRYWICYVRRVILFCLKLYIPWDKFEMVNEFKNIEKDAWEWIHNEIVFRGKHKAICMWSILISYLSEGEKPRINRIFT